MYLICLRNASVVCVIGYVLKAIVNNNGPVIDTVRAIDSTNSLMVALQRDSVPVHP